MKSISRWNLSLCARLVVVLAILLPLLLPPSVSAAVLASNQLCFPYAPKEVGGASATLVLTNSSEEPNTLTINLYRSDGTPAAAPQPAALDAHHTLTLDLAALPTLSDGDYHAVVTADKPVTGVAYVSAAAHKGLGIYRAVECGQHSETVFGPFYSDSTDGALSTLHLANGGSTPAPIQATFLDKSGSVLQEVSVAGGLVPLGMLELNAPAGIAFPGGVGSVKITTSSTAVVGVLAQQRRSAVTYANSSAVNTVLAARSAAGPAAAAASLFAVLPRLHHGSQDVGVSFTTRLSLLSPMGTTTFVMNYYRPDGTPAAPPVVATMNAGAVYVDATPLQTTASPGVDSLLIGSQWPLAIQAEILPSPGVTAAGEAAYMVSSILDLRQVTDFVVPGAILDTGAFSIIAAQNLIGSPAQISVDILNAQGAVVYTAVAQVAPGAAMTVDLRTVPAVSALQPFVGAAHVHSSGMVAGQMDIYSQAANLELAKVDVSGPTLVASGSPATFTAVVSPAAALKPITFAWHPDELGDQVNVVPSKEDSINLVWQTPGLKNVKVRVENGGPAVEAQHSVRVPSDAAMVADGKPFTLTYVGSSGGGSVTLEIPADASISGYTLTLTPVTTEQLTQMEGHAAGFALLGTGALLDASQNGELVPGFLFSQPATLRMQYEDADVAAFEEAELSILTFQDGVWMEATKTCSPPSQYVRRPQQNEVEVQICHLSPYVLAGEAWWLYLPGIRR